MILDDINDYYAKFTQKDEWEDAPFAKIKKMENDTRGEFGEKLISNILHLDKDFIFDMDTTNNSIHNDGHYDLKINGKRIEIKTSCCTAAKLWQHEPLYKDNQCDIVIFVDFNFDEFYITVLKSDDLPLGKDSDFFPNKHATLRKNRDDGWKLDFSQTTLKNLANFNVCATFTPNTPYEDIKNFIKEKLNELI